MKRAKFSKTIDFDRRTQKRVKDSTLIFIDRNFCEVREYLLVPGIKSKWGPAVEPERGRLKKLNYHLNQKAIKGIWKSSGQSSSKGAWYICKSPLSHLSHLKNHIRLFKDTLSWDFVSKFLLWEIIYEELQKFSFQDPYMQNVSINSKIYLNSAWCLVKRNPQKTRLNCT